MRVRVLAELLWLQRQRNPSDRAPIARTAAPIADGAVLVRRSVYAVVVSTEGEDMTELDRLYPMALVRVMTAKHAPRAFCAGLVFRGPYCTEAAPILKHVRGWLWQDVQRYCRRNQLSTLLVSTWQADLEGLPPKAGG